MYRVVALLSVLFQVVFSFLRFLLMLHLQFTIWIFAFQFGLQFTIWIFVFQFVLTVVFVDLSRFRCIVSFRFRRIQSILIVVQKNRTFPSSSRTFLVAATSTATATARRRFNVRSIHCSIRHKQRYILFCGASDQQNVFFVMRRRSDSSFRFAGSDARILYNQSFDFVS